MYCPKCGDEYQDGYTVCSECGVPLVEKEEEIASSKKEVNKVVAMRPVLLTSLSNDIEAQMLCGALENEGIPAFIKDQGSGGYMKVYMGYSVFEKSIYVDQDDLENAKVVLEAIQENQQELDTADGDDTEMLEKKYSSRRKWVLIVAIVFIGCILFSLLMSFIP